MTSHLPYYIARDSLEQYIRDYVPACRVSENTSWSPRAQTPKTDRVTGHTDFDEAKYNISTGPVPQREIAPAIEEHFRTSRLRHELFCAAAELTTDVICSLLNLNQPPVCLGHKGLRLWNISTNCGISTLMVQEYAVMHDGSGNRSSSGSGFLPSVVCLGLRTINQTYTSFLIEDSTSITFLTQA
ncbi:uncharacterized protein F5891DRAFT_980724 [Suillus fuscotomentosus]|uniref:Uncharacterized protein n=1 Tax=Suillus fuscotomentosus TaxID=1912939 RepID=A0AAD4HKE4_9AGAM|nr:uncharacterized protein F5891DRAFT_980724 [Suillus fuscotomentosus]KAG1899757.1 hypothetical protein F5891DRAFT_980724 [Suillus fuscotomentosus]